MIRHGPTSTQATLASDFEYLSEPIRPIPRYADFAFYYEERGELAQKLVKGNVLQVEQWYQLEVAVRFIMMWSKKLNSLPQSTFLPQTWKML